MNLKTSILYEADKEWNLQLLKNNFSTTYQTSNWAQIYQDVYDSKPLFIKVEKPNGEIVAQLTTVIHNRYFWIKSNLITQKLGMKLNLHKYIDWSYGPIIYDDTLTSNILNEILSSLEKISKEHKIQMIRGTTLPSFNNKQNFIENNYSQKIWSTYVINLNQNFNTLFNSLNKKTRYDIRKSESNELRFKVADTRDELDSYLHLKYDAIKRGGGKLVKNEKKRDKVMTEFNDAHWNILHKNELEKLFLVLHNNEIIGGITCLTFNKNMIQHGVGNSSKTELLGGTFLTWNSIKWGMENTFHNFDLGGINPHPLSKKEEQIDFYKSKWGGQKFDYFIHSKVFEKFKVKLGRILENPAILRRKLVNLRNEL